jgi:hypothetical protein
MTHYVSLIYSPDLDGIEYVALIRNRIERSLEACMSDFRTKPEDERSQWLGRMLNAVELILLFERHEPHPGIFLVDLASVRSWREAFFTIWDGDWQEEQRFYFPYGDIVYRQQYRPAVVRLFDRLESLGEYWSDTGSASDYDALIPLLPDYSLPYFSLYRHLDRSDEPFVTPGVVTESLIDFLVRDIIYWLSPEKREDMSGVAVFVEGVWVAVDLLGLLSASYETSCGIKPVFIEAWRASIQSIWSESAAVLWGNDDDLLDEVMSVFDRLHEATRKYPHPWW